MKKIGLIGAMDEEISFFKEKLVDLQTEIRASNTFYSGTIGNCEVVLVRCGVGKVNAALCAQILISEFGVTHVINSGIAGGAHNDLHLFDFVVSTDAVHHDMDATGFGYGVTVIPRMENSVFVADKQMRETAKKAFAQNNFSVSLHEGRVATGDQFIDSEEKKAYIIKNCAPHCVEMEGAAIAQVCALNDIPFLIVRCISDMANDTTEVFNEQKAAELSSQFVYSTISLF